jgi:hypothetical protein
MMGCSSTRVGNSKTLSAKQVSMTHDLTKNNGKILVLEKVTGKQCILDKKTIEKNDHLYLYDELIVNTQKKYQADLLIDAVFYDEVGCLNMDATTAKFVAK